MACKHREEWGLEGTDNVHWCPDCGTLRDPHSSVDFEEVPRATALLLALVEGEDEPCRLDHHGLCQTHGLDKPCTVAEARKLLGL